MASNNREPARSRDVFEAEPGPFSGEPLASLACVLYSLLQAQPPPLLPGLPECLLAQHRASWAYFKSGQERDSC